MHPATNAAGRRVHILHNWSWQPITVAAPDALVDLLDRDRDTRITTIELEAWDVRVLGEGSGGACLGT